MQERMYSAAEVVKLVSDKVGQRLPSHFLDYLVKHEHVKAVSEGTRKRRKFPESELEKIATYWDQNRHGVKPVAVQSRIDHEQKARAYMSFQVPTADALPLIRRLRERPEVISVGAYYGAMDLLVEMNALTFHDVVRLRRDILRDFPRVRVWPELDLLITSGESPRSIYWDNYPVSTFARILVRVDSGEDVSQVAQQLRERFTNEEKFKDKVHNIQAEKVTGAWDIVLNVEAASIQDLSSLVWYELRGYRPITKTSTFICMPRHYYHQQWRECQSRNFVYTNEEQDDITPIEAYVFLQTHTSDQGKLAAYLEDYEGVCSAVNTWGRFDLVVKVRAGNQAKLERLIIDTIGGLPVVIDTDTLVIIGDPNKTMTQPIEDDTIPSAYCLIYSPKMQLSELTSKLLQRVAQPVRVYGLLGLGDAIVALGPGINPHKIPEIINQIKSIPQLDRVETLISYCVAGS